jgi:hypothetical protein
MAQTLKMRRLVNPRRRMSLRQKLFFGSAKQRAAARRSLSGRRRTRNVHRRHRKHNVGEIIHIGLNPAQLLGVNSGRRRRHKTMARRRRNRRVVHHPRHYRRRRHIYHNLMRYHHRRRRHHNPRRRVVYLRHHRRHNRRRNPQLMGFNVTRVFGVIGGAAATKLVTDRLPPSLNTGLVGYLTTGAVASLLGLGVRRFLRQRELGDAIALGGFTYLGLKLLNDFLPSVAAYSPFGLKGMGLIAPSSFPLPQALANPGQYSTSFNVPAAYRVALPPAAAAMKGLARARRVGRMA